MLIMNIFDDNIDNEIYVEPGEGDTPENEPYDGLYDSMYNTPANWRENATPEQKQEILFTRIANMSEEDRTMFLKIVRHDNITELMDAISNLKTTSEETWRNVINKLQFLLNFNDADTSKFDFNKLLKALIPLVAALAGLLIGLRQAEKAEAEAADVPIDPDEDPILAYMMKPDEEKEKDNDSEIDIITGQLRSVVLDQCNKMINGFSY